MNKDKIETGDTVHVDFNQSKHTLCHRAYVLCIPQATGNNWIFKDCATGDICYVSEGCTVILIKKKEQ